MNRLVFLDCGLELADAYRYAIDEDQQIRSAQPIALNRVLVHNPEDVILWMIEINVVDVQGNIIDVIPDEIEPLHNKPKGLTVRIVKGRRGNQCQHGDDLLHLHIAEVLVRILPVQECAQIVFKKDVFKTAVNIFAVCIFVSLHLEKLYYGMLQFIFCKFAFFEDIIHVGTSFIRLLLLRESLLLISDTCS